MSLIGPSGCTDEATLERTFNVLLGLCVVTWAVLGLASATAADLATPVRWVISALHLSVAGLLLVRVPVSRQSSPTAVAMSLPGLLVGGLALSSAPPPSDWPWTAQVLLTVGGLIAIVTLLSLGRSFAVLPALRGVVTRGPYRLVRHPAYVGELLMILGCTLARPLVSSASVLVLAMPLVVLRIRAEEQLLLTRPRYRSYAETVRWRLVPGLW